MAKICSFVFWYFKYLSGCLLWNSVHVFHCFSTMDEAGPALRLLKRRLKPVSRAELRVGEVRVGGRVGDSWRGLHSGKIQFSDAMFWRDVLLPTIMIIMEVENICSCTNWFFLASKMALFSTSVMRESDRFSWAGGRCWKFVRHCQLPLGMKKAQLLHMKKKYHTTRQPGFFPRGIVNWLIGCECQFVQDTCIWKKESISLSNFKLLDLGIESTFVPTREAQRLIGLDIRLLAMYIMYLMHQEAPSL